MNAKSPSMAMRDFAGDFLDLFEEVDDGAVWEHRVVLAACHRAAAITSTLVEDFAIDGVDCGFHLVALHEVRSLV